VLADRTVEATAESAVVARVRFPTSHVVDSKGAAAACARFFHDYEAKLAHAINVAHTLDGVRRSPSY